MQSLGFTEQQWKEIFILFKGVVVGLENNILPVRDGIVRRGEEIWWRGQNGPQRINSDTDWENISKYPDVYQREEPKTTVQYYG